MRAGKAIFSLLAAVGSTLLILSGGCGLKSKPQPPARVIPGTPTGLRAEVEAQGVKISCAVPERNTDGSALTDLEAVEFQRGAAPEESCPTCPISFVKVGEVTYTYSPGEPMPKGRVSLLDPVGKPGLYKYRAVSRNSQGELSKPSGATQIYWDFPPAKVEGLKAVGGDQKVELQWSQVTRTADGGLLPSDQVAYQVFRSREGGGFGVAPLNPVPLSQNSYLDSAVQNQVAYIYKVRAVRKAGERLVPGPFSESVEAIPQRLTPPEAPKGLVGFPTSVGVRLVWEGGPGKGVSGYKVYRASQASGPWELLSPELVVTPYFDDKTAQQGRTYWYSVSTLDDSAAPLESQKSEPIRVHMPKAPTPAQSPRP